VERGIRGRGEVTSGASLSPLAESR